MLLHLYNVYKYSAYDIPNTLKQQCPNETELSNHIRIRMYKIYIVERIRTYVCKLVRQNRVDWRERNEQNRTEENEMK